MCTNLDHATGTATTSQKCVKLSSQSFDIGLASNFLQQPRVLGGEPFHFDATFSPKSGVAAIGEAMRSGRHIGAALLWLL